MSLQLSADAQALFNRLATGVARPNSNLPARRIAGPVPRKQLELLSMKYGDVGAVVGLLNQMVAQVNAMSSSKYRLLRIEAKDTVVGFEPAVELALVVQ